MVSRQGQHIPTETTRSDRSTARRRYEADVHTDERFRLPFSPGETPRTRRASQGNPHDSPEVLVLAQTQITDGGPSSPVLATAATQIDAAEDADDGTGSAASATCIEDPDELLPGTPHRHSISLPWHDSGFPLKLQPRRPSSPGDTRCSGGAASLLHKATQLGLYMGGASPGLRIARIHDTPASAYHGFRLVLGEYIAGASIELGCGVRDGGDPGNVGPPVSGELNTGAQCALEAES
jgi:hypothetical protein